MASSTDHPTTSQPAHLEPSELGTKEYWDALYTTEISNHAANPADKGTVWFDDSDAEAKVLEFLEDPELQAELGLSEDTTSFLDLGTGNGALLFGLRDQGWQGRMLGVDYSERSVEFAKRIERQRRNEAAEAEEDEEGEQDTAKAAGADEEDEVDVEFKRHDILSDPSVLLEGEQAQGWDVVLDKGTFDAISLSAETDARGRRISEGYLENVLPLVRDGGVFLITSCNWTEEELLGWFEGKGDDAGARFTRAGRVEYRSFSFGGVKGQTISSLCFKKVSR